MQKEWVAQISKLFWKYASKIVSETIIQKTINKNKKLYYDELEEIEESDSYVTEIWRRPKNQRRIVYEDAINGVPAYEPDSPTDEEQEENNYDIQNKYKGKRPKQIEKAKKVKKGITK